jgi:O-antigen/teichoic acid export membrane protein
VYRGKSLLFRNALLNILGQGLPLVVGVATIPSIARNLGATRFGLLGLVWGVLGYFSIFDLGLGRATTKFVAEYLGAKREGELSTLITISVASQTAIGAIGGAAVAACTRLAVSTVFHVPRGFSSETAATFYILAVSLPFVLFSLSLRAVLEAAQRFDLVNLIRTPSSTVTFLIPAVAAARGMALPGIVLLLFIARLGTCWVTVFAVRKALPSFRWSFPDDWRLLRPMLSYGGWVAISNFLSPLLLYVDRFVLGSLEGLSSVGYYTAPYEAVTRMLVVPASLATALFPAFTLLQVQGQKQELRSLVAQSVRVLALILAAPTVLVIIFARNVLSIWLGASYAEHSAVALQVLAAGVFVNSIAHLPYSYLQGVGRPDLTAKYHLAEVPIYLIAVYFLVSWYGVSGAAMAWSVRVMLDAVLLFGGVVFLFGTSPLQLTREIGLPAIFAVAALTIASGAAAIVLRQNVVICLIAVGVVILAYSGFVWRAILHQAERAAVLSYFRLGSSRRDQSGSS